MSKSGSRARKLSEGNTVALDTHALGTLQYIRAAIDAAGVLAVPGSAGIAMGCVGLAAALIAAHPAFAPHWLAIWVIASVAAFLCGSALILHQAVRTEWALFRGPARKVLMCLAPPLLVGAVLTAALQREHAAALIPGLWLLLYGSAVAAASTLTLRLVGIMGALFLVLGVTALALPPGAGNWLLGAGFGGLHLIFGVLIGLTNHEQR